jgi:hypothetical protein
MVIPESGDWTFACRSVNTSGELSTEARIVTKTLGQNLGQVIDKTIQQLIDAQLRIEQEKVDRFNEDTRISQQAAADATAKANAARDAAIAHADAIGAIVADITEADAWEASKTYPTGDFIRHGGKLYLALRESTGAEPGVSPEDWQPVGNFSGIAEALAASVDMGYQNATELEVKAAQLNALVARMPDGDGKVASVESVEKVDARVEQTEDGLRAVGEKTSSLEAQLTYRHAGDRDWNAGDRNVYAGVRTWQSVSAEGTRAVAKQVESTNVEFGAFKASTTKSIEVIATEQSAQAEQIELVGAELEGKASAESLRQVSSRVEENAQGLMAVSGQLDSVKVDLGGKASAQAMQGIEARVEVNAQGIQTVLSRAFMNVIADDGAGPLIGGMVIDNNGRVVNTRFFSHTFEVIAPSATEGMEWKAGYLRVWKGAAQRIIGTGFGRAGDDLVDYFGPNIGAAGASKSNAVMWMDASGSAYFGGQLSAGVLKNAVQTTTIQTVGVELVNGPFSTNGRTRTVTVSFSRNHRRTKTNFGSDGFVAGAGQNTATVQIYRQIGSDAEQPWQTLNATGGVRILNESDGPDSADSSWGGSFTVNDSSPSDKSVRYRAVITGFAEQDVRHESGSFQAQTITQSLAVISVEA